MGVLVPLFGCGWMQLAAFRPSDLVGKGQPPTAVAPMLLASVILLAVFQLVLRPGIPF